MKLVRNAVTEANPRLRGQKHHFTIENAPADVLEAMDDMLEAEGWSNDTCPNYEDGYSCGYWIDLSEIDCFKKAYKAAKAGVKAFMAARVEAEAVEVAEEAAHVETVLAEEFEAAAVRAVRRGGAFAEYWATVTDMNIVEAAQEWEQLYVEALAMDAARVAPVSIYDLKIPACSADVAEAVAAQQAVAPTLADLAKPAKKTRKRRKPAVTVASINNGRYTWRVKIGERVYLYVEGDSQAQQRIQGQRGHSYKDVKSVYMLHQIKQAIAASLPKRRFRA